MKKKYLIIPLSVLSISVMLAGCGKDNNTNDTNNISDIEPINELNSDSEIGIGIQTESNDYIDETTEEMSIESESFFESESTSETISEQTTNS